MSSFAGYAAYWPVLAGGLVFFALGLWLYLISEAAMERSPKPLSWVRDYRKPGFPFRAEGFPVKGRLWLIPLLFAVLGGLVALGARYNAGKIVFNRWLSYTGNRYNLLSMLICAGGAFAVWMLLRLLFENRLSAALGALLFVFCPLHGHVAASLLAGSAMFLLLYLRAPKTGFRSEVLYLCAILLYAAAFAVSPAFVWLAPGYLALHWYRLSWYLRHNQLGGWELLLSLLAALICWPVFVIAAAGFARCAHNYFLLVHLKDLFTAAGLRASLTELWTALRQQLFQPLMRSRLLEPLIDAPLAGLGFWGCFSAAGMALKRRRVQGWFVLGLNLALALVWLLSGTYGLTFSFALAVGALVKNAELGEKRWQILFGVLLGVLFSVGLALGAWALPMVSPISWRLL